ncbi:MAG TPA: serine/threonine-protein kinase [Actinomycetota bacterium]|nr:serine/threonine-protein kinase [Actinomycetota bacterium]
MPPNGARRRVADRYELGAELGHGGMGVVWRATDTLLAREVAVKEVDLPRGLDAEQRAAMRARVSREARAAARLSHPGVVTVYDIAEDGGRDYIVMELVAAPTLDDVVRADGPLAPERAARLGLGLLATLEAAHRAGIVHRDLKPKNVMVREDGTTKLTDFGIASVQGDPRLTATGLVVGSPAYMAPEQVEGETVGPAADLWALGATLWFAVEGEPPFGGGEFQTLSAIVGGEPRRPRRLGPLAPVLTSLLAKDPARRPTPAELGPLLERVAAGAGAGRARRRWGAGPAAVRPAGQGGDTPPVPVRAQRRGGGTAVLGARTVRPGRRALPPVPPVPAPGEPVLPGRPRRRGRLLLVLAALGGVLAVAVAFQLGARDGGSGGRRPPAASQRPAVPADWQAFQSPDGTYRLAHPPGWSPVDRGAFTDFVEPGGGRFFRVQQTTDGLQPLPAQRSLERSFMARHAGDDYQRVRLGATSFKGVPAAEWEFTFVPGGRPTRGYDITFSIGGHRHAILFQAGADRWPSSQDELQAFLAGYRPRG